jgi:hypothetical protein
LSRVFVVQRPATRSGERGCWVEKFDLAPAEAFGELVTILPYGNISREPRALQAVKSTVSGALCAFNPDEDYVLPVGDPVAIAIVLMELGARRFHPVRALKFDRRRGCYESYVVS